MLIRATLPFLFLSFSFITAPAQPAQPKKYALLIGINKYNHADLNKPSPLQFAEKDIADTKALFEANGYEVDVLLGEKATLKAIRDALKKLGTKGNAEGVVVIGLAGHGTQPEGDQEAYYCPFDAGMRVVNRNGKATTEFDPDTLLPLAEVLANLKASPAGSRMLLADCCRNDPNSGRGRGVGAGMKVSDLPENTAVMLACSRGQRAYEDKSWGGGHGAFFYHVLKGMEKDAVDDKGRVLADRLKVYLEDSIPEEVGKVVKDGAEQKPFCLVSGRVDLLVATGPRPSKDRKTENSDVAARAVIAKAMKAHLGEVDPSKLAAYSIRLKGTMHTMGVAVPFSGESMLFGPNRLKLNIEAEVAGMKFRSVHVIHDDEGWLRIDNETKEMGKAEVAEAKEQGYASWVCTLVPLKGKEFTFASLGEVSLDDRPAIGVKVSSKGHRDIDLYFDKDSDLLVKADCRVKDDFGQEVTDVYFLSEHKAVQGIKQPMKERILRDGKLYLETQVIEFTFSDKLDASNFAKP